MACSDVGGVGSLALKLSQSQSALSHTLLQIVSDRRVQIAWFPINHSERGSTPRAALASHTLLQIVLGA